jgi:hypothetical protein
VNEQTDSINCGSCDHDCLGGACSVGTCKPVVLASGQSSPTFIALDAANVYWTNDSQVMKCAKGGCNDTPIVLWSGSYGLNGIAVQGSSVYWTGDGATGVAMQCSVAGCTYTASETLRSEPSPYLRLTAANESDVFWTDPNGYIVKCAVGGCNNAPTNVSGQNTANEIAVDETNVYWTATDNGQVLTCPEAGCNGAATVLASGQAIPQDLAVDATNVYWVNLGPPVADGDLMVPYYTNGQIMKCALGGCNNNPTVLAAVSPAWLGAIALDATSVYWTSATSTSTPPTSPNGQIMRCSNSGGGGTPTVVASTDTIPSNGIGGGGTQPSPGIAVDDTRIYWTDKAAGQIFALAK